MIIKNWQNLRCLTNTTDNILAQKPTMLIGQNMTIILPLNVTTTRLETVTLNQTIAIPTNTTERSGQAVIS